MHYKLFAEAEKKNIVLIIKNESEHDIAFKKFLDILHHDLFENKKAFTTCGI
jgi:hypothetical protein